MAHMPLPLPPRPPTISPKGVHGLDAGVGHISVESLEVVDGADDGMLEMQCGSQGNTHTHTHTCTHTWTYI